MKRNWRFSPEYTEAKRIAFAPYQEDYGYRCALCERVGEMTSFHILGVGAHPALRCESLNLLPVCFECHRKYEDSGRLEKGLTIEKIFPNRIQELRLLERKVSKSVMRRTTLIRKKIL